MGFSQNFQEDSYSTCLFLNFPSKIIKPLGLWMLIFLTPEVNPKKMMQYQWVYFTCNICSEEGILIRNAVLSFCV